MKRLIYTLIVSMAFCFLMPLYANGQILRGNSNEQIGSISSSGEIRSKNGAYAGKIASDGNIYDRSNKQIGKIESDGTVRNRNGSSIGKINSDGTVRGDGNKYLGKIESDGTVRNSNNASIGRASGVKKEWAAVAFFFFSF
ncbi:MAG: hypothetical protein Q3998_05250 [Porphyromonas sp.]|nr:hypothetical protein [Porphyromonas sp.]